MSGGDPDQKPGGQPKLIVQGELPVAKAKLADLEQEAAAKGKEDEPKTDAAELSKLETLIAKKEAELADLRGKAKAIRDRLDKSKPAGDIQRLLAGLPKDAIPAPGPDGVIERNRANKWLEKNAIGKQVEIIVELRDLHIFPSGNDYELTLVFGEVSPVSVVKLGDHDWFVFLAEHDGKGVKEELGMIPRTGAAFAGDRDRTTNPSAT